MKLYPVLNWLWAVAVLLYGSGALLAVVCGSLPLADWLMGLAAWVAGVVLLAIVAHSLWMLARLCRPRW